MVIADDSKRLVTDAVLEQKIADALANKANRIPNMKTIAGNYTVTVSDVTTDTVLFFNTSIDITVTVPADVGSTVISRGSEVPYVNWGTGAVTFVAATGGTLGAPGGKTKTSVRFGGGLLRKVATSTWQLTGSDLVVPENVVVQTPPTVPLSVNAVAGVTSATLTWAAPSSNGNSPITGYDITYTGGNSGTATASATAFTATGLAAGVPVSFTVRARNVIGTSAAVTSNTVTPTSGGGNPGHLDPNTYWHVPQYEVPAGAKFWNGSTSLDAALTSLTSGQTLILDFDATKVEKVDVNLAPNVKIRAAAGKRPIIDGTFRIGRDSGTGWSVWGLDIAYKTDVVAGDHMLKLDGGSGDWGYSRCWMPGPNGCYTLVRPGQEVHDWRFHHSWVHDNPGFNTGHTNVQDHCFYISGNEYAADQNGLVENCLVEDAPRGRNIKLGSSSSGAATIGGITIRKCTLRNGQGPSNGQCSNGGRNTIWENLVLIDSGDPSNLTDGGDISGNIYRNCRGDGSPVGENTAGFRDAGGNATLSVAALSDYVAMAKLGFGHLAL
jgi:hypothetical protein